MSERQEHCAGCRGADVYTQEGVTKNGHCIDCLGTDYLGRDCRGRAVSRDAADKMGRAIG